MRVRVRTAHRRALVLKDLHVSKLVRRWVDLSVGVGRDGLQDLGCLGVKRMRRGEMAGVEACPSLNHGEDLRGCHVGEGDVVLGGEGEDIAPARDGLRLEEKGGDVITADGRLVGLLLFLDGAVVIDEGKGVLVVGVGVPLRPFVARAKVALGGIRRRCAR